MVYFFSHFFSHLYMCVCALLHIILLYCVSVGKSFCPGHVSSFDTCPFPFPFPFSVHVFGIISFHFWSHSENSAHISLCRSLSFSLPPSRFIIVLVCLFIKLTHADSSQITAKWNGVPGATAQGHKDLDGRQLGAKESDIVAASTGFYWLSSRA